MYMFELYIFSEKIGLDDSIISIKKFPSVLIKYFYMIFYAHAEICRFSKERATPQTVGLLMIWRVFQMPHEVLIFKILSPHA